MSGVKMIAKQVQPLKGYEHFETTTGSDGGFSFKGVFPSSDYSIGPWGVILMIKRKEIYLP